KGAEKLRFLLLKLLYLFLKGLFQYPPIAGDFFCLIEILNRLSTIYFLSKILLMIKTITAITAITIKIPTPIPALNIPSITEQLVNEISTIKRTNNLVIFFCMIFYF
ncbi:hypothetical protein, partial [Flavobacterium gawalongense]|uniref:hypothetical protein n=1 Tax=Flavobacterium gawalongense TaxID=2594432 RepID=UPI001C3F7CB5